MYGSPGPDILLVLQHVVSISISFVFRSGQGFIKLECNISTVWVLQIRCKCLDDVWLDDAFAVVYAWSPISNSNIFKIVLGIL